MASAAQNERRGSGERKIDREWLDLRELTQYAAVSERTLRSWMRLAINPLPAAQVGSKILVRRSEFDAWLEHHRIQAIDPVDIDGIVSELIGGLR